MQWEALPSPDPWCPLRRWPRIYGRRPSTPSRPSSENVIRFREITRQPEYRPPYYYRDLLQADILPFVLPSFLDWTLNSRNGYISKNTKSQPRFDRPGLCKNLRRGLLPGFDGDYIELAGACNKEDCLRVGGTFCAVAIACGIGEIRSGTKALLFSLFGSINVCALENDHAKGTAVVMRRF